MGSRRAGVVWSLGEARKPCCCGLPAVLRAAASAPDVEAGDEADCRAFVRTELLDAPMRAPQAAAAKESIVRWRRRFRGEPSLWKRLMKPRVFKEVVAPSYKLPDSTLFQTRTMYCLLASSNSRALNWQVVETAPIISAVQDFISDYDAAAHGKLTIVDLCRWEIQ